MSHPNLEVYSTLTKMSNIEGSSDSPFNENGLFKSGGSRKMANAYILETDPCAKCFEAA